jgi:hypothetical protein
MDEEICGCGRIIQQPATGRRRQRCYVCSPRDKRDRRRADVIALSVRDPDAPDSLTTASRKALDAAGVLGSWQAEAALAVARLVDQGRHGASGIAANIRAHRQCMEFALQSATEGAQVLDLIDRIFLDG